MSESKVDVTCAYCSTQFQRHPAAVRKSRRHGFLFDYCTPACAASARQTARTCKGCGSEFRQPPNDARVFCSRTCAARYNNTHRPRRSDRRCAECGKRTKRALAKCRSCMTGEWGNRTIRQLREEFGTAGFHTRVRGFARGVHRGDRRCSACGYSLQSDICHIRPVADFPLDATLAEVNAPSNLVALDKRCHWEFDHGYLVRTVEADGSVAWSPTAPVPGQRVSVH